MDEKKNPERRRKLFTTSLSDKGRAALDRWCRRHGYRISDAIELGIALLPLNPPTPPEERRGREAKKGRKP
jgi:hypothetical protein